MTRITGLNRRRGQGSETGWKKKISSINQNGSIDKYRQRSLSNYVGLFILFSILMIFIFGAVFGWISFVHDIQMVDDKNVMLEPLKIVKLLRNAKHNRGKHGDTLDDDSLDEGRRANHEKWKHAHVDNRSYHAPDDDSLDEGRRANHKKGKRDHVDDLDGDDTDNHGLDEGRQVNHEKGKHDHVDDRHDHAPDDHGLDEGRQVNHRKGKHDHDDDGHDDAPDDHGLDEGRQVNHEKGKRDHVNDRHDDAPDDHGFAERRKVNHEKWRRDHVNDRHDDAPDHHGLDEGRQVNHEKGKRDYVDDRHDHAPDGPLNEVALNIPGKLFPYFGTATINQQPKGGRRFEEFKDGDCSYLGGKRSDMLARNRRSKIKDAMIHAWKGYEENAFGSDVLLPIKGIGRQNWGNTAATMLDSLDTLWLMGMEDEFYRARDWVRDHLDFNKSVGYVSVFEVTIRCLGGLLSAYDWSHDEVFLEKAILLGLGLFKAFSDGNVYPDQQVLLGEDSEFSQQKTRERPMKGRPMRGRPMRDRPGSLAEVGTLQIEFRFLAKATGMDFAERVNAIFEELNSTNPENGLYNTLVHNRRKRTSMKQAKGQKRLLRSERRNRVEIKKPEYRKQGKDRSHHFDPRQYGHHHGGGSKITFGGNADSFYEYMLKIWIQGDKKEPMYRDMYDKAINGLNTELLRQSQPSGLWFIGEGNSNQMDHLACFMGGLLALGAYTDPLGLESERAKRDLKTARALAYTCYQMYARTPTGLSPETVTFMTNDDSRQDMKHDSRQQHYLLRPEAVETFFVLHQLTGDPIYREWGWEIFLSIDYYCKTKYGYGSFPNVNDVNGHIKDEMESFFLAETLKYLYLLMDPDTEVDILHKHVFNTEAHPLRKFSLQQTNNEAY